MLIIVYYESHLIYFTDSTMAAYVGLSQHIDFGRLQSPGDRFELRDMIGEGKCGTVVVVVGFISIELKYNDFEIIKFCKSSITSLVRIV